MVKILWVMVLPLCLLVVAMCFHLRVNLSNSMPIGIYQKAHKSPSRGDTVAVCLPKSVATEGLAKGYLLPGYCPSKMLPVLKTLIAMPSDRVLVTEQFISVNDKKYPAPQQSGVKHFISEYSYSQYWLYGKNNPTRSWDSRYFAGVKRKNIVGVYRPIFIFKSKLSTELLYS